MCSHHIFGELLSCVIHIGVDDGISINTRNKSKQISTVGCRIDELDKVVFPHTHVVFRYAGQFGGCDGLGVARTHGAQGPDLGGE